MSNRKKRQVRQGVKEAELRRAQGRTPVYDDGRRYNGYICDRKLGGCGGVYLTVDLDKGVTPMFMPCLTTPNCGGMANSMGYPRTPPPKKVPLLVEWYSPESGSLDDMTPKMIDHVMKGGLLRRPGPDAKEWQKAIIGPVFPREGDHTDHEQLTLIYGDLDDSQEQSNHVHQSGGPGSGGQAADSGDPGEGQASPSDDSGPLHEGDSEG